LYNPYGFLPENVLGFDDPYIKMITDAYRQRMQGTNIPQMFSPETTSNPQGILDIVAPVSMPPAFQELGAISKKAMEEMSERKDEVEPQQPNQNTTMILSPENSMYADLIRRQRERYGYY
jgi:hypothetical protein